MKDDVDTMFLWEMVS